MEGHETGQTDIWGNKYVRGEDGNYYKTDGKTYWPTSETARKYERAEQKEEWSQPAACGPSFYEQKLEELGGEIGDIAKDSASMVLKGVKAVVASVIGFAAAKTFINELGKKPDDMGNAVFKSGRTIACGIGIIADIIALFVFAAIFGAMEGPVVRVIVRVAIILGLYTVLGLIRIARDKPFWINPIAVFRKLRAVKVPKIVYIGIELIVTASLTKPVLNLIDSFTVEWAQKNQDTISDSLVIILGIGMLIGSIILAAIIGLIVCKLIKALTAK